jgi:hypothetical protein
MTETVELRNKPELKIFLNESGIEIVDASKPKNSGIYSFAEIKRAEFNTERTDSFISVLSWIIDIFAGSAVGGKFKNKANLKLELTNRNFKIWLTDSDLQKAKKITELINNKKNHTQQRQ